MANPSHYGDDTDIKDAVKKELRNDATAEQINFLEANPNLWRSELITMKLSCEGQMVAAKARRFQNHHKWIEKKITRAEYMQTVADERVWKCNTGRLLQQIETKIQHVNNYE
jgi:hypothetical protein